MKTMMRNHLRLVICCYFALAVGSALAQSYEVGQIWSYKTRPQDPKSTLTILRIDNSISLGVVVFISLADVNIQHPYGGVVRSLSPLPFTKAALDKSVIKLVGQTDKLMSSETGYWKWKQGQREGKKPTTFMKPVAEVVNDLEHGYIGIPRQP